MQRTVFRHPMMPSLLVVVLLTACGGAHATPTSVPATVPPAADAATGPPTFAPGAALRPSGSRPSTPAARSSSGPQAAPATPVPAAGRVYTDPQARFAIAVLPGFQQQATVPGPESVAFTAARVPGVGYNIQVDDLGRKIGPNGTVDDIAAIESKNASVSTGAATAPASVQPTTLGGKPARTFIFDQDALGQHLRAAMVIALIGPIEYAVTFNTIDTDFDKYAGQRTTVLTSFAFLANAATYHPAPTATAPSVATTFRDPQGRFTLMVPAGFRQLTPAEKVPGLTFNIGTAVAVFATGTGEGANFNVDTEAIQDGTQPADLDRVVAGLRTRLPMEQKALAQGMEDIQSATLGGEPARTFDFFLSNDSERWHGIQVVCIRGGTYFTLTFLAPEGDYAALQRLEQGVVASFTFS